jgi:ribosomal protein S27AE
MPDDRWSTRFKKVRYVRREVCPKKCGYGVFKDDIPLGRLYVIDTRALSRMHFRCGGCGTQTDLFCVLASDGPTDPPKKFSWVPAALFNVDLAQFQHVSL